MTTTMTRENEWLAKARAIEPVTKVNRDQGETDRHLPQATYEAMRDAGLYKLMLPKVYAASRRTWRAACYLGLPLLMRR